MRAFAAVMALMLLLPFLALADTPAQEAARARYAEGKEQFNAQRYDAAATLFKEAYDLYPDPAYLFNVAIAYEHKRRWRLAVEYFDRFLKAAPGNPAISEVTARREAAQKAREAEMATVNVRTTPSGAAAEITSVGGVSRCETPCSVQVDPGPVSVSARLNGRSGDAARRLANNEVWDADIAWARAPQATGRLVVAVDTPGAVVQVGGQRVPAGEPLDLAAGRYEVVVNHPSHPEHRQMVDVVEGRPARVEVSLGGGRPGQPQRIAGYVTLGVGGAMLVNGIVFAALAGADYDDGRALVDGGQNTPANNSRLSELRRSVERNSLVADVSFGVAAAGIVTGLVLWLTADDGPADTAAWEGGRQWSVLRF